MDTDEFNFNVSYLFNLLYSFYNKLKTEEHPRTNDLTFLMDTLIDIEQSDNDFEVKVEQFKKHYIVCCDVINKIYDYDASLVKNAEEVRKIKIDLKNKEELQEVKDIIKNNEEEIQKIKSKLYDA